MSKILDTYQQQAKEVLSTLPWLAQLQTQALADLDCHAFPTRHDEDWKYTSIDALLNASLKSSADANKSGTPPSTEAQRFDLPIKQRVVMHNGLLSNETNLTQTLPQGVLILPLSVALRDYPELVKRYLGTILRPGHGFHFLNTAMIHSGVLVYIPEGVVLEEPIALVHAQTRTDQTIYWRHLILAEAYSKATLIEEYQGVAQCCYVTNTVTEVMLGTGAQLTHYTIQRESKAAYHLGHVAVKQLAESEFVNHSLSLGGRLVRSDVSVYLHEEKAHALMNGIYAPTEGQHVDHHTTVQHLVPYCSSEQDYKGILMGRSRAVFQGNVIVAKNAQHTHAKQNNKNLMLCANAEVDTKPQLDIFADDVLCSHGATVGQLDEEALFYLATRGISRSEASRYLIHAFTSDNLGLISHAPLADYMERLLTQQLGES